MEKEMVDITNVKSSVQIMLDTASSNNTVSIPVGVNGFEKAEQFAFAIKEQLNDPRRLERYLTFEDIYHKKWMVDCEKILAVSIEIRKKGE